MMLERDPIFAIVRNMHKYIPNCHFIFLLYCCMRLEAEIKTEAIGYATQ